MAAGGTFIGLDALIDSIDSVCEKALDDVAEKAASIARSHAKGKLAGLIEVVAPTKGFRVIQPTKAGYYGKWVENGRAGFRPKGGFRRNGSARAAVLHFVVNGQSVFARFVGKEDPEPFMAYANDYLTSNASTALQAAVDALT